MPCSDDKTYLWGVMDKEIFLEYFWAIKMIFNRVKCKVTYVMPNR